MKTYEQMAAEVFEKGEAQIRKNRKKKRKAALAAVLCAAVCAGLYPGIKKYQSLSTQSVNPTTETAETAMSQRDGSVDSPTTLPSDNYGGEMTSDGGGKTGDGGASAISLPGEIKVVGEEITDKEAAQYFNENRQWLQSALSANGVPCGNLTIKDTGYCHISLEQGELRQNFRDYLAYNDGKIIGIITLTKENGVLSSTPAFGAPWFEDFTRFLDEHSGQELIFIYAGFLEAVLCPDGECVNPMGLDVSEYFGEIEDPYNALYMKQAVYVP